MDLCYVSVIGVVSTLVFVFYILFVSRLECLVLAFVNINDGNQHSRLIYLHLYDSNKGDDAYSC